MTNAENLLVTLSEECAEVQQDVAKALRFGIDGVNPFGDGAANSLNILTEYYQLTAVMDEILRLGVLPTLSEPEIERIKKDKLAKIKIYQQTSRELGLIVD